MLPELPELDEDLHGAYKGAVQAAKKLWQQRFEFGDPDLPINKDWDSLSIEQQKDEVLKGLLRGNKSLGRGLVQARCEAGEYEHAYLSGLELVAQSNEAGKAEWMKPFVEFAHGHVEYAPVSGASWKIGTGRDRICDWFDPSDFVQLLSIPCEQED